MKFSELNGKTILSAKQMKIKDRDDDGFVLLEFTDCTKALIISDYNENYPNNSEREYPTQVLLEGDLTVNNWLVDLEEKGGQVEDKLDGWIRCTTDLPPDNVDVLVTDGKEVWIGDYSSKRREKDGRWALVYNGASPFESDEVIAWKLKPEVPANLRS